MDKNLDLAEIKEILDRATEDPNFDLRDILRQLEPLSDIEDPELLASLSMIYSCGLGCKPDQEQGLKLLLSSAERGDANAAFNLALFYSSKIEKVAGLRIDLQRRLGKDVADATGDDILRQSGIEISPEILAGYRALAQHWYFEAKRRGATTLSSHNSFFNELDPDVPLTTYRAAYFQAGVRCFYEHNFVGSYRYFKRFADRQDPAAEIMIATHFRYGLGIEKDESAALDWYQRAASHGNGEAAYVLSEIYRTGLCGQAPDWELTQFWYTQARELGFLCPRGLIHLPSFPEQQMSEGSQQPLFMGDYCMIPNRDY